MKTISLFALLAAFTFALPAQASEQALICPSGQIGITGVIDPGVVGTPEVSHQETVVDVAAWDEVVVDVPAVPEQGHWHFHGFPSFSWHWHIDVPAQPAVTHTVHHPAVTHEITVIDSPAVMAVPPTYGYVCAPEPTPTPKASSGEGTMPWCSSPLAPGWNISLPGGGCGNTGLFGSVVASFFKAGETIVKNGVSYTCPWFFGSVQCTI